MSLFDDTLNLLSPGWVGSLIGLAGLLGAAVVYVLTRKRTSISFAHLGKHLLGSSQGSLPSEIVVQYKGVKIPRLTRSVVVVWNSGENTVLGSDIVTKDPLRFCVGNDGQVLSASVVKASRQFNEFDIQPLPIQSPQEVAFSFNFLDAKDGVVVEILHTSEERRPTIKGTLRGLPRGFNDLGALSPKRASFLELVMCWTPIMLGSISIMTSFMIGGGPTNRGGVDWSLFVMGCLSIATGLYVVYSSRRRYPKKLESEAFE